MIFSIIRWLLAIVIFSVCYIFIRKSHIVNKRKWVVLLTVIVIFLPFLSALVPIENAFVTFPTVESAYYYSKEGNIKFIVTGKESDLVIGQKENDNAYSYVLAIIPKTNEGWKIAAFGDLKIVTSTLAYDISIDVYQYKNSDDYYIMVDCIDGSELHIKDNRGSKFEYFEGKNGDQTYYSYIHCFDENYVIIVDGQPVSFNNVNG